MFIAHVPRHSHVSINNNQIAKKKKKYNHINGSLLTCLIHSNVCTARTMNARQVVVFLGGYIILYACALDENMP